MSDIKEVVSHEQALNQRSDFLATLKGVKVTKIDNTALAAKYVSESGRDDIAAISSKDCADIYNLAVLSYNIQNNDNNYTRFICISRIFEIYPGADRTSITLTIPPQTRCSLPCAGKVYALGLNLAKIESRPIPAETLSSCSTST